MKTTKLLLLLLTALLAGVCIGFFTNSAIIKARIRRYQEIPGRLSGHIMEKMTEGLELSAQQQRVIQRHIDAYVEQRNEQRRARKVQHAEQIMALGDGISHHLTPEQKSEFKALMDRMDARRKANRELMRAVPTPPPPTDQ